MEFSSDHSHFAYILRTNLEYYLSTYVSKLVVLTTSKGEIVIEPSELEFLHLVGAHHHHQNRWKDSAKGFVRAVRNIDHEDETSYEDIGLKEIIEQVNSDSPQHYAQHVFDRILYFQPLLRSFMQCEPKDLFIYYKVKNQSNLDADYLYLHHEEEGTLPIYLGLKGKKEDPHFIMHTIVVDRYGTIYNRNFSKVKVSRLRFLPNNLKTQEKLAQGTIVESRAYLSQRRAEDKALLKELGLSDIPKITSQEFLSRLNHALRVIDVKYSAQRGSKGQASFRLLVNKKKTNVDVRPPKTLKPIEIAQYLVALYEQDSSI